MKLFISNWKKGKRENIVDNFLHWVFNYKASNYADMTHIY